MMKEQGELFKAEGRFVAHVANQLTTRVYLVTVGSQIETERRVAQVTRQAGMIVENTYSGIRSGVTELVSFLVPLS